MLDLFLILAAVASTTNNIGEDPGHSSSPSFILSNVHYYPEQTIVLANETEIFGLRQIENNSPVTRRFSVFGLVLASNSDNWGSDLPIFIPMGAPIAFQNVAVPTMGPDGQFLISPKTSFSGKWGSSRKSSCTVSNGFELEIPRGFCLSVKLTAHRVLYKVPFTATVQTVGRPIKTNIVGNFVGVRFQKQGLALDLCRKLREE